MHKAAQERQRKIRVARGNISLGGNWLEELGNLLEINCGTIRSQFSRGEQRLDSKNGSPLSELMSQTEHHQQAG